MPLLEMRGITKYFPGVTANDQVSFDLHGGEVHALVGENGAGKTTLMNILYGLYRPDAGSISIHGQEVSIRSPREAIDHGIGMVHQHFMLIPVFTVLENIVLGEETGRFGVLRLEEPARRIQEIMASSNLSVDLDARIENLPVGVQQRVEIVKVLYRGAEILVFDEPTASLTPQETRELFKTFHRMKSQGRGIIFISHKLDEVLQVADRITVLRQGRVMETMHGEGATKQRIARLMVGKSVILEVQREEQEPGPVVLEVDNLTVYTGTGGRAVEGLSFTVREGEIFGIAGVEGNGQSQLVQAVAEVLPRVEGDIRYGGESILGWDVRRRREVGIGHIPEDRQRFGLLLPFPLSDNLVLGRHHLPPFTGTLQLINASYKREYARRTIHEYDIRALSEQVTAGSLSGGNQQRVVVAREMSFQPRLLVASQPTRGVDVGAMEFIYSQLLKARAERKAVLLVSADLDEILSLSDTIGVMYRGRIVKTFAREKATRDEIGLYMTGGESGAARENRAGEGRAGGNGRGERHHG
ncbi:MAG: ABC transporter ATP-binding protein [Spirochaetota bacterium]